MSTYTSTVHCAPRVGHVPTLTGGIGTEELQDFYDRYFIHSNPDSWDVTLLSRTVGVDRVVDEMHVFFRHTQEMPWILPGVPPTDKKVEIIMVSIVALRGGRLHHEHVYWDQASVLVQVGLLDPRLVPAKARENGVLRLPAIGRTSARRVLNGIEDGQEGEADNGLIYEWEDAQESEEEDEEDTEDEDDQSEEGGESQADNTVKASTDGDKKGKEVEKPQTELDDGTNNSLSSEATDDNTHGENGEKSHDWRRASVVEGTDSS